MKQMRRALGALVLAAFLAPRAAVLAEDVDPGAREWTQTRGNSSRQGASAVEALAGEPVTAWTQKLPGRALAEPVTWGGLVYVAVENGKSRELRAYRAATGEATGVVDLGPGGRLALASWQGTVLVGEAKQIRTYRIDGGRFMPGWAKGGSFGSSPCVYRGYCFVSDGAELVCFDVVRGGMKVARAPVSVPIDDTKTVKDPPIGGAVGVFQNKSDGALYAATVSTVGRYALISRTRVDDLGTSKMQMHYTLTFKLGDFASPASDAERWDMVPCRVEGETPRAPGAWIVLSPQRAFIDGGSGKFVSDTANPSGVDLVTTPAVLDGVAYSFTKSGALQSWRASGATETLVAQDAAPPGTHPGPATRAGGVVYLGNWAVDASSRRVIWHLTQEAITPSIPIGDKRIAFATKDDLVCVADASIAGAVATPGADSAPAGAPAPAGASSDAAAPAAPKTPVDMDGVLLDDGRQIEGTFDLADTKKVAIHPKDGGPDVDVFVTSVVVAEKGGAVELRGDDSAAYGVWRNAVRAAYCDAEEEIFKECAKSSLVDQARAAMQRMRENGAAEPRLLRLDAMLNGKAPRADATKTKKLAEREDAARAALLDGFVRCVEWCKKRGFVTAATVAVNEVGRLDPGRAADVDARAKDLMPSSFFFKNAPEPVKQWRRWADALLPSSAEFVEPEDPVWKNADTKPWNDGSTLCFRTRNVILFIREMEPAVVGKALRLSEGTVRALQVFLNHGEPDVVTSDADRLEIRIHRNRKDYLDETSSTGDKAMEWSAGYFSPQEKVSHFYVDRTSTADGSADIEELTRVLTHEFTHHYMHVRWMNCHDADGGAGFWVVEGMAEFVQNQAHRMDQRGLKFDDETVPGIDGLAQAVKAGGYFKAAKFVDMTQAEFAKLHDDHEMTVKLRNSFRSVNYTERIRWYDQAGALAFFFLQKKGAEVREKFVSYVRAHYSGAAPTPGWAALGYDSAEDLDKDFLAFLKKVGG